MSALRFLLFLTTIGCVVSISFSQEKPRVPNPSLLDTLQADTAKQETGGVDTLVTYSAADSIVYSLTTRTMTLYGKGDIQYKQMRLKAEEIDVNWDTAIMNARGVPDTTDTSGYRGLPTMIDGGEEYRGFELSYNFKTQKGKINLGDTEIDQGYYHGEAIKKVDRDILFVEDGRYTTCDAEDPHYYFFSPKMKVVMQDKVVAEPVYLYIADVPVFALPFGVFPNKRGRRSGLIAPAYVEDPARGRGLLHLGYYWAINDYMDWSLRSDGYTNGSWTMASNFGYNLRYYFNGGLFGEYRKYFDGVRGDPGASVSEAYVANLRHHQDIDPTTRLDVNFTYASNNSYQLTNSLDQALRQSIESNATLSKSWEGTPNSMTLNVYRSQNLRTGEIAERLPSLSFNRSQSFPFRSSKKSGSTESAWYELIGYSYGANATNNRAKVKRTVSGVKTSTGVGSVEVFGRDNQRAISQSIAVNASPKLGYLTVTPSVSFRDNRTYTRNDVPQLNTADSSLVFVQQKDDLATGSFSSGISTGTRLYGVVQPNMLGVSAFRHTLSPSLAFSYSKQVYGRNIGPKQMVASLGLGNVFEMKTIPSFGDSATEGRKIQLLNLGASLAYNFSADSLNFSEIGMNFRTDIANVINLSGGTSFNLYKFEESLGRSVNKFLINEEGRLARMTSFSLSASTSLEGEKSKKETGTDYAEVDTTEIEETTPAYYGLSAEEEPDLSIPWSLQLAWNFSENKVPGQRSRSSNVSGSLSFNLTDHWKVSATGSYDILNKELVAPSIEIYRDLHCWEMKFEWVPIGTLRHFRLEIRIRAPQLRDVKVTKQRSARSIY